MLLLSSLAAGGRDAVVNHLCAVVVPISLVYVGILCIFGEKLANALLRRDTYCKKRVKVRLYGIVRVCLTGGFLALMVVYFSIYRIWDLVAFFTFAVMGYSLIKLDTYYVAIQYTNRYITIQSRKTKSLIPMGEVTKMTWETVRGSVAYVLVIYRVNGEKIKLSSSDFIGLKKLKSVYDASKHKE